MRRIRLPSFAYPENLVVPEEPEPPELPDDVGALRLLQMVYRGQVKVSPQQMRAAIEALPFESPKLTAVGIGVLDSQAFADRLERALQRSNGARLIEGRVVNDEERRSSQSSNVTGLRFR